MRCDFCDSPLVVRTFPAADVTLTDVPGPLLHESVGAWAACGPCAELVDRGDRDGLVRRGFAAFRTQHPGTDDVETLDLLRTIHTAFWANRIDQ